MKYTFAVSLGVLAGQGVATPGNIFARVFGAARPARKRLQLRINLPPGGHTFFDDPHRSRSGPQLRRQIDLLISAQSGHHGFATRLLVPRAVVYNGDTVKPGAPANWVQLAHSGVSTTPTAAIRLRQTTLAVPGAGLSMMCIGFQPLPKSSPPVQ